MNIYARIFTVSRNKYSAINILHGTGTTLVLTCAFWRGMYQEWVMA
jgi:hypothetical protein